MIKSTLTKHLTMRARPRLHLFYWLGSRVGLYIDLDTPHFQASQNPWSPIQVSKLDFVIRSTCRWDRVALKRHSQQYLN